MYILVCRCLYIYCSCVYVHRYIIVRSPHCVHMLLMFSCALCNNTQTAAQVSVTPRTLVGVCTCMLSTPPKLCATTTGLRPSSAVSMNALKSATCSDIFTLFGSCTTAHEQYRHLKDSRCQHAQRVCYCVESNCC
jgi:hypothetical protein